MSAPQMPPSPPPMTLDASVGGLASLDAVLLLLTTGCIVLRYIARLRQKANFGADDFLMLPAWLWFVGIIIASIYTMADHFAGIDAPMNKEILLEIHPTMIKTYWAIDMLAVLCFGFIKLSVLFFYRRIFCSTKQGVFHLVTWIAIGVVTAWLLGFFILTFFVCGTNLHAYFYATSTGVCTVATPYFLGTTISNFLLDLLILLLPLPKIWSLHIDTKRKFAISAVFLLAIVGLAASITRMVNSIKLVTAGVAASYVDIYQSNTKWQYYIILEAGFAIIAACLPCLWYFVAGVTPERVMQSLRSLVSLGSTGGSRNNRSDYALAHTTAKSSGSTSQISGDERSYHTEPVPKLPQETTYKNMVPVGDTHFETNIRSDPAAKPRASGEGINVERTVERTEGAL